MSGPAHLLTLVERNIARLRFQIERHEADGLSDAARYIGLQASLEKCRRDLAALQALLTPAA